MVTKIEIVNEIIKKLDDILKEHGAWMVSQHADIYYAYRYIRKAKTHLQIGKKILKQLSE